MADPGQGDDKGLGAALGPRDLTVSSCQRIATRCLALAKKLGALDWPVEPIRTRRRLAFATLAYVLIVGVGLFSWGQVLAQVRSHTLESPGQKLTDTWPSPPSTRQIEYYYQMSVATYGTRRPRHMMISIPAGKVVIGRSSFGRDCAINEIPAREVDVAAFEIDKYEVTNEQYAKFVKATGATPPTSWGQSGRPARIMRHHPTIGVSFAQARAYAEWAGRRLPTEAEWMRAARGDTTREYPWEGRPPKDSLDRRGEPAVVGRADYDRSLFGVMDMGSNAAEWTADTYATFPGCPLPEGGDPNVKVAKGRSFTGSYRGAYCAARTPIPADEPTVGVGFRCVRSVDR